VAGGSGAADLGSDNARIEGCSAAAPSTHRNDPAKIDRVPWFQFQPGCRLASSYSESRQAFQCPIASNRPAVCECRRGPKLRHIARTRTSPSGCAAAVNRTAAHRRTEVGPMRRSMTAGRRERDRKRVKQAGSIAVGNRARARSSSPIASTDTCDVDRVDKRRNGMCCWPMICARTCRPYRRDEEEHASAEEPPGYGALGRCASYRSNRHDATSSNAHAGTWPGHHPGKPTGSQMLSGGTPNEK